MSAESDEDRLFREWRDTFPAKHWSKTDLGACRLGWDAGRAELAKPPVPQDIGDWVGLGSALNGALLARGADGDEPS